MQPGTPLGRTGPQSGPHTGVDGGRLGTTQWSLPGGATPGLNEAAAMNAAGRFGMEGAVLLSAAGRSGSTTQTMDPNVIAAAVQRGVEAALRGTASRGGGRSGGGRGGSVVPDDYANWVESHAHDTEHFPGEMGIERSQHTSGNASLPQVSSPWGQGPSMPIRVPKNAGGYDEGQVGSYRAGRGGKYNLRSVHADVTTAMGRGLSQLGRKNWAPPTVTGFRADPTTGEINPFYQKRVQGPDGSYSNQDISKGEYGSLQSKGKFLNAATGALAGAGEEGGALGGIASMLPEIAGPLGIAAAIPGLAYEGANMIQGQRQANAAYQSIYGGSNASGFGQRFAQMKFRIGSMGVLSGSQANEAFMGTSQLGMQGGERANATSMIVDEYKKIGMSVKQGIEAVTTAAQTGNSQLNGLADALNGVTKAAAAAGVNANVARQNFITAYGNVGQSVTGGQAPGIAAAITGAQTSMGRNYQGLDMSSGFSSTQTQRLMANFSGQSLNQFVGSSMGPGGATKYASAMDKTVLGLIAQIGWLQKFQPFADMVIQKAQAENRQPNQNDYTQATSAALQAPGMPDIQAVQQVFSQILQQDFGGSVEKAYEFIIRAIVGQSGPGIAGGWNASSAASAAQKASASGQVVAGMSAADVTATQKMGANQGNITKPQQTIQAARDAAGTTDAGVFSSGNTQRRRNDQNWYKNNVVNKNEQDPILAALLKNRDAQGGLYQVQTKDGPKVVNMADLEKYYRDQVQAGTVEIVSGQYAGQTVADATNMTPSDADVATAASGGSSVAPAKGKDRTADVGKGSPGGKVTLDATPLLKKYITIMASSGGAISSDATANGVAPTSTPMPGMTPGALNP